MPPHLKRILAAIIAVSWAISPALTHASGTCSLDKTQVALLQPGAQEQITVSCTCPNARVLAEPTGFIAYFDSQNTWYDAPKTFTILTREIGQTTLALSWYCEGSQELTPTLYIDVNVGPPSTATDISSANTVDSCVVADPVDTYTGELIQFPAADLDLGGPMPLRFFRYYASALQAANISGVMGTNWRHNFEWRLEANPIAVDIITSRGRLIRFVKEQNGRWQLEGRQDIPYQLVLDELTGRFTLLDPTNDHAYLFGTNGQLLAIDDDQGRQHTLSYTADGQLSSVEDGLGRRIDFIYNTAGQLTLIKDDNGREVTFGYTDGRLTRIRNAAGKTTTHTYNDQGLLTTTTRPKGNTLSHQQWNDAGRVVLQTDPLGNTTRFNYNGLITTVTDALGERFTVTHNDQGVLEQIERRDGLTLTIASDESQRRSSLTDTAGGITRYEHHPESGKLNRITRPDDTATTAVYTVRPAASGINRYDLTAITHPDGTTERFRRDDNGALIEYTDPSDATWTFRHDTNGYLRDLTNPLGGQILARYNPDGTLSSIRDPHGNTTSYRYDAQRRLIETTFADGSSIIANHDPLDRPLAITDPRGNTTRYTWDDNGNLSSITDRAGAITRITYDDKDRPTALTDDLGGSHRTHYDALNRITALTDPNGNRSEFRYDQNGRIIAFIDPNGNRWQWGYDAKGAPTTLTSPAEHTFLFTTDPQGRITEIRDPLGHSTRYSYDAMGRLLQITDPMDKTIQRRHDPRGHLSAITLPEGISATYTRDATGNVTEITDPGGNIWKRDYDEGGRLTQTTDPLGRNTTRDYDQRNRLSTLQYPEGMGVRTDGYDANGNLIQRQYSDGTELRFRYDAEDRLIGGNGLEMSRDNLGRITDSNGIGISYDPGGRITTITYAEGKTLTYRYDGNDRPIQISDWGGGTITLTWDNEGRLTTIERPNGIITRYEYDAIGRITAINHGELAHIRLRRNAAGHITQAERKLPVAASAIPLDNLRHDYDAAAQISNTPHRYDAMGRRLQDPIATYRWDLASRLIETDKARHDYDALGYRLSRTIAGERRQYVWNLALKLPSMTIERDADGNDLRYHIYLPNGVLLYSIDADSNSRRFYHFDEAGNTRFVTDGDAEVIAAYAHSPFGVLLKQNGMLDNPFTWQGQWGIHDDGNGLYYFRARYYDARSGRFLSKDPLHLKLATNPASPSTESDEPLLTPPALNPYTFAKLNPLSFHDPNGEEPVTIAIVAGGIVAAGTALYRLGKWIEGVWVEQEVVRKNAVILKDPTLPKNYDNKVMSEEAPAEFANFCASIPGTTATGPVHGAPVDDVAQFATQTAISATGLDKPPGKRSRGILSTALDYWFGS